VDRRGVCATHEGGAVKPGGDNRRLVANPAVRITAIGNANNKKVVTLAGFIGDRLRPARVPTGDDVGLTRLLVVRMSFERSRCFGPALDRPFETFSIRLCVVRWPASLSCRSFGFFRVLFCLGSEIEDGR